MQNSYSDVERRVKRYWYTDGVGELIGGGVFLLLGLYFSMQQYFGDRSLVGVLLQSGFAVILIGLVFIGRRLINFLKTRLTYPRTGYVEYPATETYAVARRVLAGVIAMAVAFGSIVIARRIDAIDSMVAVTGVLVAIILLVKQGWSSGIPRFYALSGVSFLLGAALSVSGLPRGYNLGAFYGLMGVAFLISGGLTLQHYLHENPIPVEDQHG